MSMPARHLLFLLMACWMAAATSASASASASTSAAAASQCTFCDATSSFDLSSVSTATFELHSGTPGSKTDPYVTYLATSPCASAVSDLCISGPTSDPLALRGQPPAGGDSFPKCTGLGGLNATYGAPSVTSTAHGLTITLHNQLSGGHGVTHWDFVCDPDAPVSNPPDPLVNVSEDASHHLVYNVTWRHPSACHPASPPSGGCVSPTPPGPPPAVCEGCLPPWKPTWNMSRSTALYGCNRTGPHNVEEAAAYGIMVYDWSHAKLQWANAHPMNDDEHLLRQAEAVLAVNPGVPGEQPPVWVYRNKIKALPWIQQVSNKLDDPDFAGWFVRFKDYKGRASNNSYHVPACDWYGDSKSGPPKCSGFYHDQVQSPTKIGAGPAYCRPTHDLDNVCREQCDCGPIHPCGEYTFDHRNASFSDWFINEYMISNMTLRHKPVPINLGWLDDGIGLNGMSEGAPPGTWAEDTGSTPQDMQDHFDSFLANVARLQRATLDNGGFYWQMIQGGGPEVRNVADSHDSCHKPPARNVTAAKCAATLREWCTPEPEPWRIAHLYLVCPSGMVNNATARDATAEFLLTRGDFAWIGYGWMGCFSMPDPDQPWLRPRPALWDMDYGGRALGPCQETGPDTGVFVRQYPRAKVSWDCNTGSGQISVAAAQRRTKK